MARWETVPENAMEKKSKIRSIELEINVEWDGKQMQVQQRLRGKSSENILNQCWICMETNKSWMNQNMRG